MRRRLLIAAAILEDAPTHGRVGIREGGELGNLLGRGLGKTPPNRARMWHRTTKTSPNILAASHAHCIGLGGCTVGGRRLWGKGSNLPPLAVRAYDLERRSRLSNGDRSSRGGGTRGGGARGFVVRHVLGWTETDVQTRTSTALETLVNTWATTTNNNGPQEG